MQIDKIREDCPELVFCSACGTEGSLDDELIAIILDLAKSSKKVTLEQVEAHDETAAYCRNCCAETGLTDEKLDLLISRFFIFIAHEK